MDLCQILKLGLPNTKGKITLIICTTIAQFQRFPKIQFRFIYETILLDLYNAMCNVVLNICWIGISAGFQLGDINVDISLIEVIL